MDCIVHGVVKSRTQLNDFLCSDGLSAPLVAKTAGLLNFFIKTKFIYFLHLFIRSWLWHTRIFIASRGEHGPSSCGMRAFSLHSMWDPGSPTRAQTVVSCIARKIFNQGMTGEVAPGVVWMRERRAIGWKLISSITVIGTRLGSKTQGTKRGSGAT